MRKLQACFSVLIFATLVGSSFISAGTVQAQSIAHGTVVALQDTSYLWIADEQGVLHWGGDSRALEGKYIDWDSRLEVSLDQLTAFERGDPWLSAGLLKDGDPIYLVKWETDWAEPQLIHIQSWSDVELFGITADNYSNFSQERSAWEAAYGFTVSDLQVSTLTGTSPLPNSPGVPLKSQKSAVVSRSPSVPNNDDEDDDNDADDDTPTATATATPDVLTLTPTATPDVLTLTPTATPDVLTLTPTATPDVLTLTPTATPDVLTLTPTATPDVLTLTPTATPDVLTLTPTATPDVLTLTPTATPDVLTLTTATPDVLTLTPTATPDLLTLTPTATDPATATDDTPESDSDDNDSDDSD